MIELIKGIALGTAQAGSGGGGQTINNEDLTITANGTYTASEGYTGIGTATVNVGSLVENFDIHGTPTFSGDAKLGTRAVSGLSASSYLTTKDVVDWGTGAWNIHFRFIHHASSGTQALIANSTNVGSQGISATITNNVFKLFLSSNGSSNDILNGGSSTYTFSDSVEYDLDIWFTGSAYGFTALPHDNSAGTSESLVTSSSTLYASTLVKAIGNNLTGSTNFFQGTIYLDDLTIRTNAFDWVAEEVLASESKYGATINNFLGDVNASGVLQAPTGNNNLVLNGVKQFYNQAFEYRFVGNNSIKTFSCPDWDISTNANSYRVFNQCFWNSSSIEEAHFDKIETVNANETFTGCFQSCINLTKVTFNALKTISGQFGSNVFYNTKVSTSPFPNLESLTGGQRNLYFTFAYCSYLTSISFDKLSLCNTNQTLQSCFSGCSNLTSISFPALKSNSFGSYTNQFSNMLAFVTGCTVHFPSNLQSVIGSWSDVTNGFGGTNTTVLFDLPATE